MSDKFTRPLIILIILFGIHGIAANLAHPVTPALLKSLEMPGYMFGLALAVMQFTNFLFSPFWGVLCNHLQARRILLISCWGYALGQFIFGYASSQTIILIGRAVSGFFVSGAFIASVFFLVRLTTPSMRKTALPILMTSFTVMGTFGQFIGGVFGELGIRVPFNIQILLLLVCGLLFYLLLDDLDLESNDSLKTILIKSNPIQSFVDVKSYLTPLFIMQFLSVFLIAFASTAVKSIILCKSDYVSQWI